MMMYSRYFKYNGIEIPEILSRIRIESFFFEQRTLNNEKPKELNGKVGQKMNKTQIKV
jgi:hypothetical protein